MTPIVREGGTAEADAAAVSSSSDDDADDSMMAEEEEEDKGNGIGPKHETASAAALQELIGRAIGQVEGLTRGEEGREGGASPNEQDLKQG